MLCPFHKIILWLQKTWNKTDKENQHVMRVSKLCQLIFFFFCQTINWIQHQSFDKNWKLSFADSLSLCVAVLCIVWAVPLDADELPGESFLHFPSPLTALLKLQERHSQQMHKNSCYIKIGRCSDIVNQAVLDWVQQAIDYTRLFLEMVLTTGSIFF